MKIFFLSKWYDIWPLEESWGHAYRHFGSVAMLSFPWYKATPRDAYEEVIRSFQPDFLHIGYYKGEEDLRYDFLRETRDQGIKIVAILCDLLLKPRPPYFHGDWQYAEIAPLVNFVYLKSPSLIKNAEGISGNFKVFHPCTDPEIFHPVEIEKDLDLLFLGHARKEGSRERLLVRLDQEFNLCVAGTFYEEFDFHLKQQIKSVHGKEFCKWNSRAKIGLSLASDGLIDLEEYYSERLPNIMATKTFAMTTYTPGLERIFTRKEHLDWYESEEELVELIHYWLEHEQERERVAQQGYEFVIKNLTYRRAAKQILQDCGLAE